MKHITTTHNMFTTSQTLNSNIVLKANSLTIAKTIILKMLLKKKEKNFSQQNSLQKSQ